MFLWEDEDSPPPPLLLTPSPPPPSPRLPSSSFSSWFEALLCGTSVRELSLIELEGEGEETEVVLAEEDGGVSWCAGMLRGGGAEPVAEVNRCSGGSEVQVEIQARSSTRRSSREPNSTVTSSPTPSIRAIAHGNAHRGQHRSHTCTQGRWRQEVNTWGGVCAAESPLEIMWKLQGFPYCKATVVHHHSNGLVEKDP